jgi:hypothetical protein
MGAGRLPPHLILPLSIGTTKKGIGPTYAAKAERTGLRMAELLGGVWPEASIAHGKRIAIGPRYPFALACPRLPSPRQTPRTLRSGSGRRLRATRSATRPSRSTLTPSSQSTSYAGHTWEAPVVHWTETRDPLVAWKAGRPAPAVVSIRREPGCMLYVCRRAWRRRSGLWSRTLCSSCTMRSRPATRRS